MWSFEHSGQHLVTYLLPDHTALQEYSHYDLESSATHLHETGKSALHFKSFCREELKCCYTEGLSTYRALETAPVV